MSFNESSPFRMNGYFSRLEVDDEDGNEFTDRWSTGELLFLASAVQRSGDKNWVSVSRAIKMFSEPRRPSDWYMPKNCALQYSKLLKGVEDIKKKSLPRTERETSEDLLVKNLTDKRLNELSWLNQQTKVCASGIKSCSEMIENGEMDDQLDDLIKQIEELEKREDEDFKEWITRRESLNAAKRLNKRRVPLGTGKVPSKLFESKRKHSPIPDQSEDTNLQIVPDILIKTEVVDPEDELPVVVKPVHIKTEIIESAPSLNALLDKPTNISPKPPTTPTSPLLTSLLRNVASSSPGSQIIASVTSSPLKECDSIELMEHSKHSASEIDILKSKESPGRSSGQPSNRPVPASSPLLNSLLKNSPCVMTTLPSLQLSPSKDVSVSKAVSSPQSFFNPSSALATAAAQQLAVATSTISPTHQFFPHDLGEGRKSVQSSPVNSACLSAPTLSKLLEMPPSTPGRLPPLPIVETSIAAPVVTTSDSIPSQISSKSSDINIESVIDLPVSSSPQKNLLDNVLEHISIPDISPVKASFPSFGEKADTTVEDKSVTLDPKSFQLSLPDLDVTSQENIDIIEAVCESYNAIDVKNRKQEPMDVDLIDNISSFQSNESMQSTSPGLKHNIKIEKCMSEDSDISVEKLVSSIDVRVEDNIFASVDLKETSVLLLCDDDLPKKIDIDGCEAADQSICEDFSDKIVELEEERGLSCRKFYKSRPLSKKGTSLEEDSPEKMADIISVISPKLTTPKKLCLEEFAEISAKEEISSTPAIQDAKVIIKSDLKSPVAKKPRLFEKTSPVKEKKDLSEDEMPLTRRSGRRENLSPMTFSSAKKGRSKSVQKSPPAKQDPKDQYEFSESTEENSVGYQAANTLCYMPRVKEESRFEDSKIKLTLDSEDSHSVNVESSIEKKYFGTPLRNKQVRTPPSSATGRRNLFPSDEERLSDSLTSDEASNPTLGEDKLKKWRDSTETKEEESKMILEDEVKPNQRVSKNMDSPKKKQLGKKSSPVKSDVPTKKEKKSSTSDVDVESPVCSRDSEDASHWCSNDPDTTEVKESNPTSVEVEAEANDSRLSLSVTTESEKPMEDVESYEYIPDSSANEFSPLTHELKEEKDSSQSGKQDWYGPSPKSSEPVSQSSEDSEEYESDNWDNQSVSTNKSSSTSMGQQSRFRRKEKESQRYKAWKKAIHIVLSEASAHKYANVFLHKVTNDVAPGYSSVVYRPMDLSQIKKNIDSGVIKTTEEFHRDMMLMFQNAIMYNNRNHNVYQVAVEMQKDVIKQIKAFLTTQTNGKDENVETTSLRGARTAKTQKGYAGALKPKDETD